MKGEVQHGTAVRDWRGLLEGMLQIPVLSYKSETTIRMVWTGLNMVGKKSDYNYLYNV